MLIALWRRMWNHSRPRPRGDRHLPYRPRLECLERRELPAWLGSALVAPPVPEVAQVASQTAGSLTIGPAPICVTVAENSAATVIDLGPVFAGVRGLQHEDGLQLAVLGNT